MCILIISQNIPDMSYQSCVFLVRLTPIPQDNVKFDIQMQKVSKNCEYIVKQVWWY